MGWEKSLIIVLALIVDMLIGDPHSAFHPVSLLGRMIAFWEKTVYRSDIPGLQRLAGVILVLLSILPVCGFVVLILFFLENHFYLCLALNTILLWGTISLRSLGEAGKKIYLLLHKNNIQEARKALGLIVGRDTEQLEEKEIVRATVETVAESISDGIIAPLFYFFIGGAVWAWAYRVINTLDSMVGYKNERYLYFGWFAAKLDDIANYLPARLTALLIVGSAFLFGKDWRHAAKILLRDARKHLSPNSGYPEAAVAGALDIKLGGLNYYGGVSSFRSYLGDSLQVIALRHIDDTIRLLQGTVIIFVVLTFIIAMCI